MDGIGFYFTLENILDIHYVQVLPVYQLLERIYTQGILHNLRTNFTVHVSGQIVAQWGKSNNQGSNQKEYRQYGKQNGEPVQFGHTQRDNILKGILIRNGQSVLELDITPKSLSSFKVVIIVLIITLISKYILDWYLRTKSGMLLRAVGDNDHIITSLGVNKGKVKVVGLAISNGLVALSGCVFAQQQRYFDVSMGTGTMVIGLASVIIGTSLFRKVTILRVTSSVVIGSVIYKACVAIAIRFGFESTDLKFITAALFLLILVLGMERNRKVKVKVDA